jgi:hypothetical protein
MESSVLSIIVAKVEMTRLMGAIRHVVGAISHVMGVPRHVVGATGRSPLLNAMPGNGF